MADKPATGGGGGASSEAVEKQVTFRLLLGNVSAFSHSKLELTLRPIGIYILEMEDVLFHLNSAVVMPENPQGESSADGSEDDAADPDDATVENLQEKLSGIKVLALIFRELELDADKRVLVTGHTDTSGTAKFNFKLSEERSQSVLYLLEGGRDEWAKLCYGRHNIEDYKQIMTYVHAERAWLCDPNNLKNQWDVATEEATKGFIDGYNTKFAPAHGREPIPSGTIEVVKKDGKKRWTKELWQAVYDIYSDDMASTLDISGGQLKGRREELKLNGFADRKKKYVSCGESFPIDDAKKDKYRSQSNRRVEILLFDKHEVPVLDCPAEVKRVHREEECPIWHRYHFVPQYIDPGDLYAVVYYMRFQYYNVITGKAMDVPEGLRIEAYENETERLETASTYKNGVYRVKVQFKKPLDDKSHEKLHFEFKAENKYIYTANEKSDPVMVFMKPEDMAKLKEPEKLAERLRYYDLPGQWSSRFYWTRGESDTGTRFEEVVRKLKPLGGTVPDGSKPFIFSLDDIVLLDGAGGTQDIRDHDHSLPPRKLKLNKDSRVKIFVLDKTAGTLKLFKTGAADKTARIPFPENLVSIKPEDLKQAMVVFFRDGFYTVADRRTARPSGKIPDKHVIGARAALRDDTDYHKHWAMNTKARVKQYGDTGDYDLHYFHHRHLEKDHPVSFLIYYVSTSFIRDVRDPAKFSPIPSQADVDKFSDEGVYNAMARYAKKKRYLEETGGGDKCLWIKPVYFFDERETFQPAAKDYPSTPINFDKFSETNKIFTHNYVGNARKRARGGKSKFLAFVCRDDFAPARNHGYAYHWSIRPGGSLYSIFKLHKTCYTEQPNAFGGTTAVTEHGETYSPLTFAHELGHATGLPDEYRYTNYELKWKVTPTGPEKKRSFHSDDQGMVQYSMNHNYASIMYLNIAPRLHNLWYAANFLGEMGTKPVSQDGIKHFLGGKKFVVIFEKGSTKFEFVRNPAGNPAVDRDIRQPVPVLKEAQGAHPADAKRTYRLEVYDLGQDESARNGCHGSQNNYEYDGILVVGLAIRPVFVNDSSWAGADKVDRLDGIQKRWLKWGGKYRLVNGKNDLEKIMIYFFNYYKSSSSGVNYTINFMDKAVTGGKPKIAWKSGRLEVAKNATMRELVDYFLNRKSGDSDTKVLGFVKQWLDGKLHDNYKLEPV